MIGEKRGSGRLSISESASRAAAAAAAITIEWIQQEQEEGRVTGVQMEQ